MYSLEVSLGNLIDLDNQFIAAYLQQNKISEAYITSSTWYINSDNLA